MAKWLPGQATRNPEETNRRLATAKYLHRVTLFSTLRLHRKLEELGQALVNIRATIQDGKDKVIEYIRKMTSGDKAETRWEDKPLHSIYHHQTEEVAHI